MKSEDHPHIPIIIDEAIREKVQDLMYKSVNKTTYQY